LKRESKNALMSTMSTGSQTNLLWKEGSQRDQSPEWTFSRRSLTKTKPGRQGSIESSTYRGRASCPETVPKGLSKTCQYLSILTSN
jgi:hypothetical protein